MIDPLVKRLRTSLSMLAQEEAADRIAELELEIEIWKSRAIHQNEVAGKLEAKLAKAVEIGNRMAASIEGNYYIPGVAGEWRKLTGGKDE